MRKIAKTLLSRKKHSLPVPSILIQMGLQKEQTIKSSYSSVEITAIATWNDSNCEFVLKLVAYSNMSTTTYGDEPNNRKYVKKV